MSLEIILKRIQLKRYLKNKKWMRDKIAAIKIKIIITKTKIGAIKVKILDNNKSKIKTSHFTWETKKKFIDRKKLVLQEIHNIGLMKIGIMHLKRLLILIRLIHMTTTIIATLHIIFMKKCLRTQIVLLLIKMQLKEIQMISKIKLFLILDVEQEFFPFLLLELEQNMCMLLIMQRLLCLLKKLLRTINCRIR